MKNILKGSKRFKYVLVVILLALAIFLISACGGEGDYSSPKDSTHFAATPSLVWAATIKETPPSPPKLTPEEEFLQLERNISIHNRKISSRGVLPQNYNSSTGLITLQDCKKLYSAGICNISFYTPSKEECGSNDGVTASGEAVTPGYSVAADTKKFPIGTLLYIEDWGVVEVMDRGGSVKGNRIDICVFDRTTALNFGRLKREVWVCQVLETSAP